MIESFWNESRVAQLKLLLDEDKTCAEIAAEIGEGVTRNAVIGKCRRLGLPHRQIEYSREHLDPKVRHRLEMRAAAKKRRRERKWDGDMQVSENEPIEVFELQAPILVSLRVPFRDLRDLKNNEPNQCRYIADEPPGPDYLACGNETLPGESYCPHCRPLTVSNNNKSQEERATHIAMGVRKHLRLIRKAA